MLSGHTCPCPHLGGITSPSTPYPNGNWNEPSKRQGGQGQPLAVDCERGRRSAELELDQEQRARSLGSLIPRRAAYTDLLLVRTSSFLHPFGWQIHFVLSSALGPQYVWASHWSSNANVAGLYAIAPSLPARSEQTRGRSVNDCTAQDVPRERRTGGGCQNPREGTGGVGDDCWTHSQAPPTLILTARTDSIGSRRRTRHDGIMMNTTKTGDRGGGRAKEGGGASSGGWTMRGRQETTRQPREGNARSVTKPPRSDKPSDYILYA